MQSTGDDIIQFNVSVSIRMLVGRFYVTNNEVRGNENQQGQKVTE
jgi:hypothetical protein